MQKKYCFWGILLCFFSFNLSAESCMHDIDCHGEWEDNHCVCGVHGYCKGMTKNRPGTCQCFGKEASCETHSEGSQKARIRAANPQKRHSLNN